MRWTWFGLAIMLALIGLAALLGVFYRAPTSTTYPFDFSWIWGIIGLFFAFFSVLPWIIGWGGWRWGYRYRRRHGYSDDAYEILRDGMPRGEITKRAV